VTCVYLLVTVFILALHFRRYVFISALLSRRVTFSGRDQLASRDLTGNVYYVTGMRSRDRNCVIMNPPDDAVSSRTPFYTIS